MTGLLLERVMGIEPTSPAWEAGILPMYYTRVKSIIHIFAVLCNYSIILCYHKRRPQCGLLYIFYMLSGASIFRIARQLRNTWRVAKQRAVRASRMFSSDSLTRQAA